MVHRLILVILCGLATGALAKEARRPDAPPSPKGCEWAGPGYVKLEGSETCVKVSGSVRAEFEATK